MYRIELEPGQLIECIHYFIGGGAASHLEVVDVLSVIFSYLDFVKLPGFP